jgi:hypothetical protein
MVIILLFAKANWYADAGVSMVRLRRWVSLVAIAGVLLHAALIVRHNSLMVGADAERAVVAAILGSICHGDAQTASADSQLPSDPATTKQPRCPICLGFTGGMAVLPDVFDGCIQRYAVALGMETDVATTVSVVGMRRPPARGPPLDA